MRKPPTMRITVEGKPGPGRIEFTTAKDILLHVIRKVGAGNAVELAGSAIRAMSMEERFTACNLGVELGSRTVQVAPDETTFEYLKGRKYAPTGANWEAAVKDWRTMVSDQGAQFDREATLDVSGLEPILKLGMRAVSTISRNFPNRQGRGSITHLASPAMAVAAAVTGRVTDVRKL